MADDEGASTDLSSSVADLEQTIQDAMSRLSGFGSMVDGLSDEFAGLINGIKDTTALLPILGGLATNLRGATQAFADGFAHLWKPDEQAKMLDEAALKADNIYSLQQDLIASIGGNTDTNAAFNAVTQAQRDLYDMGSFYSEEMKFNGISLRKFYKDESQLIEEYAAVINTNLLKTHYAQNTTQEGMRDITLMARALGYKEEMMQTFLHRQFAITGEAGDDLLKQTLAYSQQLEEDTGISSKIIAEGVGHMMENVSLFGDMTVEQMARASAEVAKLGLSMSSVSGMVGQFNDFESAAGNVAKLTQALGVQVDVMDAVSLANENPELLMEMFREQFDIAGIDIHSLSMPMKRALADIFGAKDTQEIEQMFGNASSGLESFLAGADAGLSTVGDADFDQALNEATTAIQQLRIAEGGMRDAAAAAARVGREAMSSALAGSMNVMKERIEQSGLALADTQSKMLAAIGPRMIRSLETETARVFDFADQKIAQMNDALSNLGEDTTLSDILEKLRVATGTTDTDIQDRQVARDEEEVNQGDPVIRDGVGGVPPGGGPLPAPVFGPTALPLAVPLATPGLNFSPVINLSRQVRELVTALESPETSRHDLVFSVNTVDGSILQISVDDGNPVDVAQFNTNAVQHDLKAP